MENSEYRFESKHTPKYKRVRWDRVFAVLVLLMLFVMLIVKSINTVCASDRNNSAKENVPAAAVSTPSSETSSIKPQQTTKYDLTVCIDPGHGDYDPGTVNSDQTRLEKDDDLRISLKIRDCLEKQGVNVVMTRSDDTFVELEDRTMIANNAKCDFFVCMHRNAFIGDMRGVEVWVNNAEPKEDTALAQNILSAVEKVGISNNRGVCYGYVGDRSINYHVNIYTYMPSCLVELGFLTDETDNKDFDTHIDEYAKAIADAVIKTATELGVTDKNGKRLINGPFYNHDKRLAADANAKKKPLAVSKPYSTQEKEV